MASDRSSVEGQIGTLAVIILTVVNVLFSVLGIIGNSVTCLAVWKNPLLQAGVNFCIVSLSVADLLVCVFTQPIYVLSLNGFTSSHFMIFYYVVTSTSLYASLNNLLLLTANRVVAIFYPLRYKSMISKRNISVGIGLIWVLSLIEGVLRTLTMFKLITPYIRISALFLFICMYAKIFHVSRKQRNKILHQTKSLSFNYQLAKVEVDNNASKTALVIVGTFVFSFLPITLLIMLNSTNKLVIECSFTLMCCSSAANPLVYSWRNHRFRKEVEKLFPCVCENRVSPPTDTKVLPAAHLTEFCSKVVTDP